jgi:hypothetical protein
MRRLALLALLILLSGCSHTGYNGDGQFIDNGVMAYSRRYVIDLGPVDLSKPNTYSFTLSGLPRAELVVGIRIVEETQNTWNEKRDYPAVVRMQLQNEQNETAILEEGSLNAWVRTYGVLDNISELYRRGEARDIPLPGGGASIERVGVKASGGWGTYFYSDVGEKYKLTVEVLASSMTRRARVMVVGWSRS